MQELLLVVSGAGIAICFSWAIREYRRIRRDNRVKAAIRDIAASNAKPDFGDYKRDTLRSESWHVPAGSMKERHLLTVQEHGQFYCGGDEGGEESES